MEIYIIYILVGLVGGLLVGFVGGGMGVLSVPALMLVLKNSGINPDITSHLAIGTSLALVATTTAISSVGYQLNRLISWHLFKKLVGGIIFGALIGSAVSIALSGRFLQMIFGVFLIGVALLLTKSMDTIDIPKKTLPLPFQFTLATSTLSSISTFFGVSDSLLLVPFLRRYDYSLQSVIATSSLCNFIASVVGSAYYLYVGLNDGNLPTNSFGYIYLPAFTTILLASSLATPIGIYLNKVLPEKILKTTFAILLSGVGLKMVF